MTTPQPKRRRKLIKPGIQLRLTGGFLVLALVALILQAMLFVSQLTDLASRMPSGGGILQEAIPSLMATTVLVSAGALIPIILAVGILSTFRVAGPIHRFEVHLQAIARGEDPGPCRIREDDQLHELCDALNDAVEHLRDEARVAREEKAA